MHVQDHAILAEEQTYSFATIDQHPRARQFRITRRQAERAYYRGDLVGYKPAGYVWFLSSDIDRWIDHSRSDFGRR